MMYDAVVERKADEPQAPPPGGARGLADVKFTPRSPGAFNANVGFRRIRALRIGAGNPKSGRDLSRRFRRSLGRCFGPWRRFWFSCGRHTLGGIGDPLPRRGEVGQIDKRKQQSDDPKYVLVSKHSNQGEDAYDLKLDFLVPLAFGQRM